MSHTEKHYGNIVELDMPKGLSYLEQNKWLLEYGIKFEDYNPKINDFYTKEATIVEDTAYKIIDTELDDYGEFDLFFSGEKTSMGYVVEFYNGGGRLSEVIGDLIKKNLLNKGDK